MWPAYRVTFQTHSKEEMFLKAAVRMRPRDSLPGYVAKNENKYTHQNLYQKVQAALFTTVTRKNNSNVYQLTTG